MNENFPPKGFVCEGKIEFLFGIKDKELVGKTRTNDPVYLSLSYLEAMNLRDELNVILAKMENSEMS